MTAASVRTLVAAILAAGAAGATLGLAFPLLALNLDDWGVSEASIGLFTLAAALSTLGMTPFAAPLLRRFGARPVMAVGLLAVAAAFASYPLMPDYGVWMGLRGLAGAGFTLVFVASEALILHHAPTARRGLVVGLYASTIAGSMAVGGEVVRQLGHIGPGAFWVGAGLAIVGALALVLPGPGLPPSDAAESRPAALFGRIWAAPLLMAAPLTMGAIETAAFNFLPIWARRESLGDGTGAAIITAMGLGNLLLQPLVGILADRFGARAAMLACGLVAATVPLVLALIVPDVPLTLGLLFVWSGLATGLYTAGLVLLAKAFAPGQLASANAAYALCYGAGQVAGPAAAGVVFGRMGPDGLLVVLAGCAGAYVLALLLFGRARGGLT